MLYDYSTVVIDNYEELIEYVSKASTDLEWNTIAVPNRDVKRVVRLLYESGRLNVLESYLNLEYRILAFNKHIQYDPYATYINKHDADAVKDDIRSVLYNIVDIYHKSEWIRRAWGWNNIIEQKVWKCFKKVFVKYPSNFYKLVREEMKNVADERGLK